jgi:PAS domain-containing protein
VPERRQALAGPELGAPGALERWFASAPWGLAVFDRQHRFVRVNTALADLVGVPVEEHAGRRLADLLPAFAGQIEPMLRRAFDR